MNVGHRIATTLAALGVKRAYGLPGEDHMALLHACAEAGIDYCTAYNESAAVLMAATDAQVTGTPGVVILSLAPGVSNGINGLLHAYMERIPLLVLSGQHPAARLPFIVRQGFDIEALVRPVTKWTARCVVDTDVSNLLCKALDIATAGPAGPVYVEVPDDVASSADTSAEGTGAITRLRGRWLERRTLGGVPRPEDVDRILEKLSRARRPVLVAGGRTRALAKGTVEAFSTAFRCPAFTSSSQKGTASTDAPYFAGTFLNQKLEARLLGRSDFVLMVNPEAFDYYNRPWPHATAPVAVSEATTDEWLFTFSDHVCAPADPFLWSLVDARSEVSSEWTTDDIVDYRSFLRATLLDDRDEGMSVAGAVEAALRATPRNAYIVADAGFSKPLVALLSDPIEPGRYLASNALSTMGFSIPAAIAASRAGAAPLIAFLGDGSLLMRATELASAPSGSAAPVFVAMMDRSLTQIEIKQERRGLLPVGAELPELSCERIAGAFGIGGVDVTTTDALEAAVEAAWDSGRPLLVGAHVRQEPSRRVFEAIRG